VCLTCRSRLRKRDELEDLKRENGILRTECDSLKTRNDALEIAVAEYRSLYENELKKSAL
jgi:hypothetical protein